MKVILLMRHTRRRGRRRPGACATELDANHAVD
ncbi:hypothetical protein DFR70_101507 [Nocardia tenerifensis]|uniref:Uncharacterized protein n=1 Tax=Nocardia tenerifensis TaxID=228006 RepID=A0A318KAE8_9NOCA|nr:hypothetical protein DFR70_101507 [Nocardia tenerifensis]